jgi:hypothetical protein
MLAQAMLRQVYDAQMSDTDGSKERDCEEKEGEKGKDRTES